MNDSMKYIKKEKSVKKMIRTEILFAPILIVLPLIVGIIFIYEWYTRGLLTGESGFNTDLILGAIIIIGNILFDVPFIKSLIEHSKKK